MPKIVLFLVPWTAFSQRTRGRPRGSRRLSWIFWARAGRCHRAGCVDAARGEKEGADRLRRRGGNQETPHAGRMGHAADRPAAPEPDRRHLQRRRVVPGLVCGAGRPGMGLNWVGNYSPRFYRPANLV